MNERLNKAKNMIKRYAPTIVATVSVTALVILIHSRKSNGDWIGYVLNQEQRDLLAKNPDAVVMFDEQKVLILGQPWNPDK